MSDLDKTNEARPEDAPAKKRGRPKKRVQEEAEDTAAKRRGRPKKSETAVSPTAVRRERPTELVFALDIGTRSVIGIVAEQRDGQLHILATERLEHKTRAMLDGQIHDVPQVAAIIREVKRRLTERTGTLSSAAVAAAGRALYTMTADAEQDITGTITPAQQRDLDFAGVQAAQRKLAHSHTVDDPTRYYCVGYSTIRYELDGNELKTLVGQRGRHAKATVIATFLPRQVVDSMQSALRETHLEMRALTLEPIAGINVLIPSTMRHLNLVLVDIGAGTSDVAITRGGSVIAYGMVPMAGDEITEAISREYLLDFNIAEDIKRKAADGQDVSFTDILGMKLSLSADQVLTAIKPGVEHLANAIAKQILELNGEPQAVMLVGGGARTPMMPELVAAALGIPEARVAVRQPDEVDGVADLPAELHAPDAVTPLGILKIASINTLHFLAVWINDIEYSLFNFRELNVSDALLAAGISLRKYNGRPGMGLMITVNGERRSFPGTMGTLAQITIDGKSANLDSPIHDDCRIKLVAGENGTQPEVHLSEIVGTVDSYTVILNGEETTVTASILVNESVPDGDPVLRDGDVIVSRRERTLGEVLRAEHLPPTGRRISYTLNGEARRFSSLPKITLNDAPAPLSTMLHEGDVIEYEETAIPTVESVLDLSAAASYATITYEGREHQVPASGFSLTINGREASPGTVVEDGAVIAYQKGAGTANVSEALLAVGFTPPPATSRVTFTLLVNGVKADFTSPIHTGDTLEVAFTPLDIAGAAAAKSSEDAPAASAILSGIAARAQLPQNAADIAPKEPQTPPAPAQGGDNITIDSLMRYD